MGHDWVTFTSHSWFGLPRCLRGKESSCQCRRCKRHRFSLWVRKIPWSRQPTRVFLPGKFHGQRSLADYSPRGHEEADMTEQLSMWLTDNTLLVWGVHQSDLGGFFSLIWPFVTPWTITCQAPLPMGLSQQKYWNVLPSPPPGAKWFSYLVKSSQHLHEVETAFLIYQMRWEELSSFYHWGVK